MTYWESYSGFPEDIKLYIILDTQRQTHRNTEQWNNKVFVYFRDFLVFTSHKGPKRCGHWEPARRSITIFCTVLYCTVLYCTILYCTVLYYTVLYCLVLYCTVLYFTVLYYTIHNCTVLYCTALYCTYLYCILLYHNIL